MKGPKMHQDEGAREGCDGKPVRLSPQEMLNLLDRALAFDARTGTDLQWTELMTQALNARGFIAALVEGRARDWSWIEWRGGPCPVALDALVDVKWNNGAVSHNTLAGIFADGDKDLWADRGGGGHIVAYRLASDSDAVAAPPPSPGDQP